MYTNPNQNTIVIHREMPKSDFLQIKNENWQTMIKETQDYYAFVLYLYFAANANGYTFALSPAAITEATGLPRSTYYKKLEFLKEKGYIVEGKGKTLHFYEVSQKSKRENVKEEKSVCVSLPREHENLTDEHENLAQRQAPLSQEQNSSQANIEIDNRYSTDNEYIEQILEGFSNKKTLNIKSGEFVF